MRADSLGDATGAFPAAGSGRLHMKKPQDLAVRHQRQAYGCRSVRSFWTPARGQAHGAWAQTAVVETKLTNKTRVPLRCS